MTITPADLDYVAKLAKLEVTQAERQQVMLKFSSMIDYMRQLQELDTTDIEPTTHVLHLFNVFRADEIKPCLPREQALANAPEREGGYFKVPSIL